MPISSLIPVLFYFTGIKKKIEIMLNHWSPVIITSQSVFIPTKRFWNNRIFSFSCVQIHLPAFGRVAAWSLVQNGVHRPGVWLRLLLARRPRLLTALGPDELGWSFGGKRPEVSLFLILYPRTHCKCEMSGNEKPFCPIIWIYQHLSNAIRIPTCSSPA